MESLVYLTAYHWLALGLAFLLAEALGAAGFLIGAAVAALANAIVVWLVPELAAGLQLVLFSLSTVVATYTYFHMFRDANPPNDQPRLNLRSRRLVGRTFVLDDPVWANEEARVQIGDTRWKVQSDTSIDAGTKVRVLGANTMSLLIAPANEG